MVIRFFRVWFL